jgi:hypothetical protein
MGNSNTIGSSFALFCAIVKRERIPREENVGDSKSFDFSASTKPSFLISSFSTLPITICLKNPSDFTSWFSLANSGIPSCFCELRFSCLAPGLSDLG